MDALIRWSIRYRSAVAALSVAWLVAGIFFAFHAPLDVFPEFVPPQVTIQTEAPGFAPEHVEQIVTRPIEAAVNGAPGIESIRSESVYGLSVVLITFKEDVDPETIRQGISERLATLAGELPAGVEQPKLTPLTSSTMDVLKFGLLSNSVDPYTLRDIADWTINPHLLALPGIARVTVYGGAIRQVQIQPDLERLAGLGLTVNDVMEAGKAALTLRGGGTIDTSAQRITLDAPPPTPDPQAISQALVAMQDNTPITIGQVANVTFGPAVPIGDATIMGKPGVLVTVSSQFGANTLEATDAVERALEDLKPALKQRGIDVILLHRPASFIERALGNLEHALALGSALILVVLYAFLRSWKAALISFLAIPLSLLAAIFVLAEFGQTLNTMTLGGFALALGVLVDDAIIDIENIMRRLRLAKAEGRDDDLATIEEASIEIRGSMLYGTLAVIFVFLPILFTGGVQGRFIGPMALTFIIAVIASMVVALTVTPALCALLLTGEETKETPRLVDRMKEFQAWCMEKVRTRWRLTVAALAGAAAAAIAVAPFLRSELIPQFREGHFVIQMAMAAQGTSVGDVTATGVRISNELLKLPFILAVGHQIGRADLGEDTWSPDKSEFHVELTEEHEETETEAQEKIRDVLERFPEVRTEAMTFLGDRISESLSGETAQVVINLTGTDLETLERSAEQVERAIANVEGLDDLRIPKAAKVPTLSIKLDHAALTNYGLTARDALETVQTAFAGTTIGQTFIGAQTVDVVVILAPNERDRIEQLSNLLVSNAQTRVLLGNVASISVTDGRVNIQHEGAQRRVNVNFNGSGERSLRDVVAEVKERVGALALPPGVYVSYAGQAEEERAGQLRLALLTALSIALVVIVLTAAFKRRALAAVLLINVPFCLIGGMAAIVASGIGLTLGSLVGLVTVFGIGARNSVMMLAHVEHLVDNEGHPWSDHTIRVAAAERFAPVFMTALMAALGLVPLALGLGRPGHEIEAPMAIAILGGLATATFLNLVVLPEALIRMQGWLGLGGDSEERHARRAREQRLAARSEAL
ncbi:efflux RND transporter permease subunit [uncultured Hyphomicrobium sp.]|uniref:efflux RND transporter permease subunit n=1 Tax=uncultured Hyphomicrobium sp. TaxID=194373 RepID=UPI0025D8406A|nr:efflux RND transporter permease subunit [uncultured Hyphomicrobium sp.]